MLLTSKRFGFSQFSLGFEEIWHQVPCELVHFEKLVFFNEKRFVEIFSTESRVSVKCNSVYFLLLFFQTKLML